MVAEEIKSAVLLTAQITELRSSGCVQLAELIYQKTGKRLGVTTLKRVYGFAYRKFNISPYTLSVMAEYSGYYEVSTSRVKRKTIIEIIPVKELWTIFSAALPA